LEAASTEYKILISSLKQENGHEEVDNSRLSELEHHYDDLAKEKEKLLNLKDLELKRCQKQLEKLNESLKIEEERFTK